MMPWSAAAPTVLASFMASLVEFVEALTIVLAVGIVRGWRSALLGAAAGLVALAALVFAVGPTISRIPLHLVQLWVGTLLLLFGLRWLRKAILRAAGVLPLHDEAKTFAKETAALHRIGGAAQSEVDPVAFLTVFKSVVLEGIEVVFIVIAIGAGGRLLVPAVVGASLALALVALLGLWLHRPLTRIPENALKFGVGVMLSAFGAFWVGEGIGIDWPGADSALVALIVAFLAIALGLVRLCAWAKVQKRRLPANPATASTVSTPAIGASQWWLELWGLFVDDSLLALGIVAWVFCGWIGLFPQTGTLAPTAALIFPAGLAGLLTLSILRRARSASSSTQTNASPS